MPAIASPPVGDSLIETEENKPARRDPFFISKSWLIWLQESLVTRVQTSPDLRAFVRLTGQNAAIGATPLPIGSVTAGRYLISFYARITTVDGVSSSLTVRLHWTESAISLTTSGAAMTGNTTTTVQSGTIMVEADANSALSYSTLYASNTIGQMFYRLSVVATAL